MGRIEESQPRGENRHYRPDRLVKPLWRRAIDLVADLVERENAAAAVFESRWSRQALRRFDPELDRDLSEQRELFSEALGNGTDDYIQRQGEAMIRGWHAAIRRMADAGQPDDAYQFGCDPVSGTCVVVGPRPAEARARELYGDIVFLTPDEVAVLAATVVGVAHVKKLWPGAQVTRVSKKKAPGRRL